MSEIETKDLLEMVKAETGIKNLQADKCESGETRISYLGKPLVGIALSGGGIRSAAFNLGVLQGLASRNILKYVSYLSTVSGGGYTGGFWSKWLHENQTLPLGSFPEPSSEEAHSLYRFGNFLFPGGKYLSRHAARLYFSVLAMVTITLLVACTVLCVGIFALFYWQDYSLRETVIHSFEWFVHWEKIFNLLWPIVPGLLILIVLWLFRGMGILARSGLGREQDFGQYCLLHSILWHSSRFLITLGVGYSLGLGLNWLWESRQQLVQFVLTTPITLSVSFAASRSWLIEKALLNLESPKLGFWARVSRLVLRLVPVLIVVLVIAALTFGLLHTKTWKWGISLPFEISLPVNLSLPSSFPLESHVYTVVVILFLVYLFFHPHIISLHELYRSRISRAFLGSAIKGRGHNHRELEGDDVMLHDIKGRAAPGKPFHLVCCAANDILGDSLDGAKSAVLSPHGFWLDNKIAPWAPDDRISLSTALTISGSAFNSQMGFYTKKLGFHFAFLMASLNLRLGAWILRKRKSSIFLKNRLIPRLGIGKLYLSELFSLTRLRNKKYVHLSDGGHFENFGLYELVRRRVPYIIVSEAGTDPRAASNDLGNAIRRIRVDFGIEIEIDVSSLEPDSKGFAQQHIAVGTINYNPSDADEDLGILVYLRTGLTNDEPIDVARYSNANPSFPYEATGNQFFSPDQWEAYRKLGEHVGNEAFRYVSENFELK